MPHNSPAESGALWTHAGQIARDVCWHLGGSGNMKPLIASVGILSLFATCADAVTIRLDGHPTINQINMNQRPPWDSIPDMRRGSAEGRAAKAGASTTKRW